MDENSLEEYEEYLQAQKDRQIVKRLEERKKQLIKSSQNQYINSESQFQLKMIIQELQKILGEEIV